MTQFVLGLMAGAVLGVLLAVIVAGGAMVWAAFSLKDEGEWIPPADW